MRGEARRLRAVVEKNDGKACERGSEVYSVVGAAAVVKMVERMAWVMLLAGRETEGEVGRAME